MAINTRNTIITNGLVVYLDPLAPDKFTRNLIASSNDFSSANWTKTRSSVTASSILSPLGTSNGVYELNMATGSNDLIRLTAAPVNSPISGGLYTFSIHVKQRNFSGSNITVGLYNASQTMGSGTNFAVNNNFQSTGSFSFNPVISGSGILKQSIDVGNGWYRLAITVNFNTITPGYRNEAFSNFIDLIGYPTGSSNVGSGIYVWGPQFEYGTLTPYQPAISTLKPLYSPINSFASASLSGSSLYAYNTVNKSLSLTNGAFLIPSASVPYSDWSVTFAAKGNFIDGNLRSNARSLMAIMPQGGSGTEGYIGLTLGTFNNQSTLIQSGSFIYVGGQYAGYRGSISPHLIKINESGSLDPTFNMVIANPSFDASVYNFSNLTMDSLGRIWGTGTNFGSLGISIHDPISASYTTVLNTTNYISSGETIIDESTNSVWSVGHSATVYNSTSSIYMTKFRFDDYQKYAEFDTSTSFNVNTQTCAALDSSKNLYVGGTFSTYKSTSANNIVKINGNTAAIDTSFNYGTGTNGAVNKIRIQQDDKIIVVGAFTTYSGSTANRIVRLNTDGTIDPTYNTGVGFNATVGFTQLQSDGKLIAIGSFTSYSGSAINRIVRLNTDGTIDTSFNVGTGLSNIPTQFIIQTDGKIVVLCTATTAMTYSGSSFNDIIRINSNGTVDTTFSAGNGFDKMLYRDDLQARLSGSVFYTIAGGTFTYSPSRRHADHPSRLPFLNNWHIYTITFDSTSKTFRTYLDGAFRTSGVATSNLDCKLNPRTLYLNNQNVEYGPLMIHNRALSQQEITQNFNSLKSRYNL